MSRRTERAQRAVETFLGTGATGPPARIVVRKGDPRRVLLEVAAQHDADLVVLDTHGRTGVAHMLLGSVAEAVIREATCDVLVARAVGAPLDLP